MTEEVSGLAKIIWNYHLMHQKVDKADVILVLGNRDTRVAEYATKLWFDGYAPYLVFSGNGSINNHKPGREKFIDTSEAEVFADVAIQMGVPKEAIIIENESQNTGENYKFAIKKMGEKGIRPLKIILVQKPYMERRTYATGKVWLPDTELMVTSPQISFDEYMQGIDEEYAINTLVGDLQRIKEYPNKGFQIEQEIPEEVWQAYEKLVELGYDKRLVKD